mgnify:CR=1 FL=1
MSEYGQAPLELDLFPLASWDEFMHYQYLPVRIPECSSDEMRLPERLRFLAPVVARALRDARTVATHLQDPYVYVTARRGFATPDNPLNRPGWHCDGFGTDDLNYVWWDTYPTRFWIGNPGIIEVSDDHHRSIDQFEALAVLYPDSIDDTMPGRQLYRLNPFVIHTTPNVPPPGTMRSFLKISVSRHRYNLVGNSRNHLFEYRWPMVDRDVARNDPHSAGADFLQEVT